MHIVFMYIDRVHGTQSCIGEREGEMVLNGCMLHKAVYEDEELYMRESAQIGGY